MYSTVSWVATSLFVASLNSTTDLSSGECLWWHVWWRDYRGYGWCSQKKGRLSGHRCSCLDFDRLLCHPGTNFPRLSNGLPPRRDPIPSRIKSWPRTVPWKTGPSRTRSRNWATGKRTSRPRSRLSGRRGSQRRPLATPPCRCTILMFHYDRRFLAGSGVPATSSWECCAFVLFGRFERLRASVAASPMPRARVSLTAAPVALHDESRYGRLSLPRARFPLPIFYRGAGEGRPSVRPSVCFVR